MIILLSIVIFSALSFVMTKIVYDRSFPRIHRHDDTINAALRYEDIENIYPRELVNFLSNETTLQGYSYYQEDSLGLVVIAHGLGGGADSYLAYAKWFLDNNYSVFMYDATGSFDSEGKTTKGFPQSLIDLESALNHLSNDPTLKELDLLLFGHSWGGYAVTNALHLDFDIKAVVSVAAPYHANAMIFEQTKKMMSILAYTQYPFLSIYQRLLFGEYAGFSAVDAINQSDASILIIHGINDDTIDYNGSAIIAYKAAITNPNTIFITGDQEGRDNHNNLFRSDEAITYLDELNVIYRALYEEHNQTIPYEINQAFYQTVDRFKAQELNEDLMQEIHNLYLHALTD